MPDEQPRYFTAVDLFWEVFHTGVVAAGCYAGWKAGGDFLSLLLGGLVGRAAGIGLALGLRSWAGGGRDHPSGSAG